MIKITLFENLVGSQGTSIEAKTGQSLMKAAVSSNIEGVAADCGGTLTCATCHVMVREPWLSQLPAMTDDEDGIRDAQESRGLGDVYKRQKVFPLDPFQ